jgi:hypothetical protein
MRQILSVDECFPLWHISVPLCTEAPDQARLDSVFVDSDILVKRIGGAKAGFFPRLLSVEGRLAQRV